MIVSICSLIIWPHIPIASTALDADGPHQVRPDALLLRVCQHAHELPLCVGVLCNTRLIEHGHW
jgi:hypothetical protein